MARSVDSIDRKAFEADFFLGKLAACGMDFFAAQCYFSAFVNAARSITFAMKAVLSETPGFEEWYAAQQARLREIPLARFFLEARNETQKIGHTPVGAGKTGRDVDGRLKTLFYFVGGFEGDPQLGLRPPEKVRNADCAARAGPRILGVCHDLPCRSD